MTKLDDFSLDQLAGAVALTLSSVGALFLVCFKSHCLRIKICWGLTDCIRQVPSEEDQAVEEEPVAPAAPDVRG